MTVQYYSSSVHSCEPPLLKGWFTHITKTSSLVAGIIYPGFEISITDSLPPPQYNGEQSNLICGVHSIENIAQKMQQTLDVSEEMSFGNLAELTL